MVTFIIVLLIVGLIVGAIARLLMPGRDPIGIVGTIVLGIVGSLVGGFLQNLIEYHSVSVHSFHFVGFIGSIIGAWVLLLLLRLTGVERGRRRYSRLPSALRAAGTPGSPQGASPSQGAAPDGAGTLDGLAHQPAQPARVGNAVDCSDPTAHHGE